MKRLDVLALVVALVAVGLATASHFSDRPLFLPAKKGSHALAQVALVQSGGQCRIAGKTTPVRAGRGQVIVWHVSNRCDAPASVDLRDFTSGDPLEPTCVRSANDIPPRGQGTIVCPVRDDAEKDTYPYKLGLNNVTQADPDVVVEY